MNAKWIACVVATFAFATADMANAGQGGGAAPSDEATPSAPPPPPVPVKVLTHCDTPLGTVAVAEAQPTAIAMLQTIGLGPPSPMLRVLLTQSNCVQVVDRLAAIANGASPDSLPPIRWAIALDIVTKDQHPAEGLGAALSLFGTLAGKDTSGGGQPALSGLSKLMGGIKVTEVHTTLTVTDAPSGAPVGMFQADGKSTQFSAEALRGYSGGNGVAILATIPGYGTSDEGKLVAEVYVDAIDQMVDQLRTLPPPAAPSASLDDAAAPAGAEAGFTPGAHFIASAKLVVRAAPHADAPPVGNVSPGTTVVTISKKKGGWWLIKAGDMAGWVQGRSLVAAD